MKILRQPAYYEPEQVSSSHMGRDLEEAYLNAGFNVEIIAPTPTRGISEEVRQKYKRVKYEEKYDGQVIVRRFAMFREGKNPFLRAIRYILCNIIQFSRGIRVRDVDIIVAGSTPPTQGLLVALVKKKLKVPVVYNLQDVFPDSLVDAGFTKRGTLLWKLGTMIENYTYNSADKIRVISNDIRENLLAKGVPAEKIEVLYNWVNENEVFPVDRSANILFDKYELDRTKFYVVYAGNLGYAQNVEVILDAAEKLIENQGIQFVIFAGGSQVDYFRDLSSKMELTNVRFLPLQPPALVRNVYSLGDVSVVSCKPGFGKSAMPSKTWSIMSTATAVLASFDEGTELHSIIEKNNVGLFTKAGDTEALKDAILRFFSDRELCRVMGSNGRTFILENLTKEKITKQYVNMLIEVKEKANVQR